MIYPVRLVKALPLVFSVGADHDSVTLVGDVVAPLDEPLELDVEVTGVETTGVEITEVEATGVAVNGVEVTGVEATGEEALGVEAIGVLPALVVGSVPVLAGGVTATTLLLASLAAPALCDEPPHPASRTTEMSIAPRIWVISFQRRSIFMCIASLMGKPKKSALAIAYR
jgi:hypothetical protein